tara:strand:+ start:977 stop:1462 length:486 start_codon:yes stop_codon:yes gene_type:complete
MQITISQKNTNKMDLNKIIAKALSTAQPTTEALLQIINATQNPTVATEILLGIYEAPAISPTTLISREDETNYTFISYNPFTDEVTYSYNQIVKEYGWIYNGHDVLQENAVSVKYDAYYASKQLGLTEDELKANHTRHIFGSTVEDRLRTNIVSLNRWTNG